MPILLLTPFICHSQANLEIWPVTISASSKEQVSVLWLKNVSDSSTSLQVRVLTWEQKDNKNIYSEQNRIYAEPSFMVIAAGKQTPIRFFGVDKKGEKELSYKVVIDELPQPSEANKTAKIKVRMQYILPFFVYQDGMNRAFIPGADSLPKENHSIIGKIEGKNLLIFNNSVTHLKVTGFNFCHRAVNCIERKEPVGYVLPGQTMRFEINENDVANADKVFIESSLKKENVQLSR